MRSTTNTLLAALVVLLAGTRCAQAELASAQEALTIARNYVNFILVDEGSWNGAETAEVVSVQEFKRGDRTLGYFCQVRPQGYLVLSLHKELAPVRAYSTRCNLDPDSDEGLTDLIKGKMENILAGIEQQLGRPLQPDDKIGDLLEINYRAISDALLSETFDPQEHRKPRPVRRGGGMNYQEGETMLTCNWHQQPPYNDQCPGMSCDWSQYDRFNYCARAGCVAVVGAQVMYHWRWPPAGSEPFTDAYDWPNMCNEYIYDGGGWFYNENEESVTWEQINAVAELCSEVGLATDMDYGCDSSGTPTAYLEDAFEDYFRYDENGCVIYRSDYDSQLDWFNALRNQLNVNRPLPYRVEDHAIVNDGWRVDFDVLYLLHMNYGWPNDSYDAWWVVDELHLGNPPDEYAIAIVVPDVAIGSTMGSYYPGGVRRYFDRDTAGTNAWFSIGQDLQILRSGFLLVNSGNPSDAIQFNGEPGATIRFFLEGNIPGKTRIRIQGGGMKINGGGEMVIR
ncbi:MAG: C10 family peptidase [Planctomycetes bacterium]|nr:C10 family peptidase [Planctomycetota bacterium]